MTVEENRIAQLRGLVDKEASGKNKRPGYAAVAKRANLNVEYIYQLYTGRKKTIGHEAARAISKAYAEGRPDGWFDQPTGQLYHDAWEGLSAADLAIPDQDQRSDAEWLRQVQAEDAKRRPDELLLSLNSIAHLYDQADPLTLAQVRPLFSMLFGGADRHSLDSGTIAQRIAELLSRVARKPAVATDDRKRQASMEETPLPGIRKQEDGPSDSVQKNKRQAGRS